MEAAEQLKEWAKQGITLTGGLGPQFWSNDKFEAWLETKSWSEENKEKHRDLFEGVIVFYDDGSFDYDEDKWDDQQFD